MEIDAYNALILGFSTIHTTPARPIKATVPRIKLYTFINYPNKWLGQEIMHDAMSKMYYSQIVESNKLIESKQSELLLKLNETAGEDVNIQTKSIPGFTTEMGVWELLRSDQMISTTWHQNDPYNAYCPMIGANRAAGGCVPLAIAQILLYHKSYPAGYDWALLEKTKNPSDTEYASAIDLAAQLIHEVGLDINIDYGYPESFANENRPARYFADGFDFYENNNILGVPRALDYDSGAVMYSLGNRISPVFVSGYNPEGSGHAWVISGYKTNKRVNKLLYYGQVVTETTEFQDEFYHTYGLKHESKNGYYLPGVLNFSIGAKMIPSLVKK